MPEDTPQPEPLETFISVDVETAGPNPSNYSLLSIGACLVDDPDQGFYIELQPVGDAVVESSLAVGGLSMEHLAATGVAAAAAMEQFEEWLSANLPTGHKPIFVGFNAPFDWMFVADYFWRFLGRNPFGHAAVDIKAYYMGLSGSNWAETSLKFLSPLYLDGSKLSHNALGDAQVQAQLFRALRAEAAARP